MNLTLQRKNVEDILFIDVKSVRASEVLQENSKEYELFSYKYRDRETGELPSYEETVKIYNNKARLTLGYQKIVAISLGAFGKDGRWEVISLKGTEKEMLRKAFEVTKRFKYICGYNIINLQLPMMIFNASKYFNPVEVINNDFNTSDKKPWDLKNVIDLKQVIEGTYFHAISFREALYHYGIDDSGLLEDNDMLDYLYYGGKVKELKDYTKASVECCKLLYDRLTCKCKKLEEDMTDTVEDTDICGELIRTQYLSDTLKEKIKTKLKKVGKPTAKEKEQLKTILNHVYVIQGMFKKDSKDIKKSKEDEIEQLINEIWK